MKLSTPQSIHNLSPNYKFLWQLYMYIHVCVDGELYMCICVDGVFFCFTYQQRCIAESNKIPSILPDALVPFHWPRVDLDQLLCVKLVPLTVWLAHPLKVYTCMSVLVCEYITLSLCTAHFAFVWSSCVCSAFAQCLSCTHIFILQHVANVCVCM